MFTQDYADVFAGDERWQSLPTPQGKTFEWAQDSTYVRKPPYFEGMSMDPEQVSDIEGARVLAKLGEVGTLVMTRLLAFVLLCIGISIMWAGWAELNGIAHVAG